MSANESSGRSRTDRRHARRRGVILPVLTPIATFEFDFEALAITGSHSRNVLCIFERAVCDCSIVLPCWIVRYWVIRSEDVSPANQRTGSSAPSEAAVPSIHPAYSIS